MGLRDIETNLPPGFRFFPSDEELVCHYLSKKVANERISQGTLVEVDLHTREPWELPDVAKLSMNEWYFFSFRDRKYATGSRTNRATKCGYWKATGKDRIVNDPKTKAVVGMRKTLVFYRGRAPNGIKSDWVMHEFRLENPNTPAREDWVLCRVFHKRKREAVRCIDGTASSAGNGCFFSVSTSASASATAVDDERLGSSPPPPPPPLGVIEGEPMMPDGNCCEPMQHMGSLSSFSHTHVPHQEDTSSNTFLNLAVLHHNFLDFPQAQEEEHQLQPHTHMMGMGSSLGDDCGFFFDDIGQDPDVIASLGLEQDIYKA